MVKMGAVWDGTVDVLTGRGAMIVRIALVTLFLPGLVQDAVPLVLGTGGPARIASALLGIVVLVSTLLGTLALTAAASDPLTDEPAAYRIGAAALPATIGTVLLIGIVFAILLIPGLLLLVQSGFDYRAAAAGLPQSNVSLQALGGFAIYLMIFGLIAIWAGARLLLLYAVIVNERRGVGAIRRSFELTRGLTLRIIGVVILYAIVILVAVVATQSVVGLIVRLALGPDSPTLVAFLTSIAVALVTTAASVLQPVFAARLFAAVRGSQCGIVPFA